MKTVPDSKFSENLFKAVFEFVDGYRQCEWTEKEIKESLRMNIAYCIERYMKK